MTTIPQLQELTNVDDNTLLLVDSGIQSYKVKAPNLKNYMVGNMPTQVSSIEHTIRRMLVANWHESEITSGTQTSVRALVMAPSVPALSGARRFVMVGNGPNVYVSGDGIRWTEWSAASGSNWSAICWSPEKQLFVAVAQNAPAADSIMVSPNGGDFFGSWTKKTAPKNMFRWHAVAWSAPANIFVAVGQDPSQTDTAVVMTSPDGDTWTARDPGLGYSWADVIWVDELNLFVAVGFGDGTTQVMTSPDGITWTGQEGAYNDGQTFWGKVTWSPELELLVAVGERFQSNQYVMTSPDGVNWTGRLGHSDRSLYTSVAWSPELGLFFAPGSSTTAPASGISYDGINWEGINVNGLYPANKSILWSPYLKQFIGTNGAELAGMSYLRSMGF